MARTPPLSDLPIDEFYRVLGEKLDESSELVATALELINRASQRIDQLEQRVSTLEQVKTRRK